MARGDVPVTPYDRYVRAANKRARVYDAIAVFIATAISVVATLTGFVASIDQGFTIAATVFLGLVWLVAVWTWRPKAVGRSHPIRQLIGISLSVFALFAVVSELIAPGPMRPALVIGLPLGLVLLLIPRFARNIIGARERAARTIAASRTTATVPEQAPSTSEPLN